MTAFTVEGVVLLEEFTEKEVDRSKWLDGKMKTEKNDETGARADKGKHDGDQTEQMRETYARQRAG